MELLGRQVRLPSSLGYGHVYCLLDKDGEITKRDLVGLGEASLGGQAKTSKGIAGLFNRLMRASVLHVATEEDIIFLADEGEPIASFEITAQDYENALARFRSMHDRQVPYDRTFKNCVHYANEDLKAAGVDIGNGLGLTAGAFFKRALKQSQGNLLAPPLGIEIVERTIPTAKPR